MSPREQLLDPREREDRPHQRELLAREGAPVESVEPGEVALGVERVGGLEAHQAGGAHQARDRFGRLVERRRRGAAGVRGQAYGGEQVVPLLARGHEPERSVTLGVESREVGARLLEPGAPRLGERLAGAPLPDDSRKPPRVDEAAGEAAHAIDALGRRDAVGAPGAVGLEQRVGGGDQRRGLGGERGSRRLDPSRACERRDHQRRAATERHQPRPRRQLGDPFADRGEKVVSRVSLEPELLGDALGAGRERGARRWRLRGGERLEGAPREARPVVGIGLGRGVRGRRREAGLERTGEGSAARFGIDDQRPAAAHRGAAEGRERERQHLRAEALDRRLRVAEVESAQRFASRAPGFRARVLGGGLAHRGLRAQTAKRPSSRSSAATFASRDMSVPRADMTSRRGAWGLR